ncbi:MAG: histidine kinase [Mariniphaga sp.]|nr:histidine kinase [Mariniphaga sp.]
MTVKLQYIIHRTQNSRALRILLHITFWIIVGSFYFIIFNSNSEIRAVSYILTIGLLPIAFLEAYFFNYILIPKYLGQNRYSKFFLFSFYTVLTSTWMSFLIVMFALIFILNRDASLDPAVLHPELQVISLNFIVFFAISIKQVKRIFYMQQEKNELEKNTLTTELKLKEAELKLLKAQVHPHFLFNTLNNLYGLTLEKSNEAPKLVLQLSEILDYILYRCDEKLVSLDEELANLKNYIEIEKIRYSGKLKLTADFPKETGNLKIAPLILLPFLENAFKHGVSHFPGVAFVNLKISIVETNLFFKIENSKNPATNKEAEHNKGVGLKNVRKRLDLIYPGKYMLNIDEKEELFSVNLTLQLEE